ncbi:hypothetical protein FE697_010215 [Mumia zhuanghuii]|uniref:Ig-like domain repeat protein n=2 Tax=Mumia TaxID=1546255 RepID=A0ABW1QR94_9ACTN|nr:MULTISPECIES: Ig-like domain repeat protein [Mumia]KAA1423917.1 hypothetical protein FE697_010215 [Mumia zhuanghuii]
MKITPRTVASVAASLALVAGAGGVAVAADPLDWYDGDSATVADPDDVTTLKIVRADGTEVTSGTLDDPLGAFAVAADEVRAGDTSASLFVHLTSAATAAGAWSGQQASGTTRFSGSGAVPGPTGVGAKPFVSLAGSLPLDQTVEALPSTETTGTFPGVYALRLRTSSATGGVSNAYASAYVKVTGSSWTLTDPPSGVPTTPPPAPVATVRPTWGAGFAYGATRNVTVAVGGGSTAAKGTVRLYSGSTAVSSTKALDASGRATLTIARGVLRPGVRRVKVVFTSTNTAVVRSATTAEHAYAVARGTAPAPTWKVSKKVTARKAGKLLVSVARPAGLVQPTGRVTVVLKRGKKTVVIRNKALSSSGKVTVTVPKQKAGKWKVTVKYLGSTVYLPRSSAAKTLVVAKK